ncbi:MAG TPA: hypothetical protein VNJ04_10590 [Gemmatimonadaceae bacterium]|nr:hypothetical protein [Gemmatimonadaceae bacterium]
MISTSAGTRPPIALRGAARAASAGGSGHGGAANGSNAAVGANAAGGSGTSSGGDGSAAVPVTGATNRYPRRGTVST